MMREKINVALKEAQETGAKRRMATLRLVQTAIKDRDAAARGTGRDGVAEEEVLDILLQMVRQRDLSVREFEESSQLDLAEREREERDIIREFLPPQLDNQQVQAVCEEMVRDINANGLRDIGRCMNELKARYPGKMDFVQASCVVKSLLRSNTSTGQNQGSSSKAGEA